MKIGLPWLNAMIDFRRSILIGLGASAPIADEVLAYNENVFQSSALRGVPADEPFVEVWRAYRTLEDLRSALIQLNFPIQAGISGTDEYLRATRRGELPSEGSLLFSDPSALHVEIHPSAAGHIPLVITTCRDDFVSLVRALTRKNEPDLVPHSMGACMVSGYSNWDRIRRHRNAWEASCGGDWSEEFLRLLTRKELYQDRFILLSDGPYSAVPAEELCLSEDTWRKYSLVIRREHECAHYFTRRMLGSMRNRLLDEIIADYMGIVEITGRFRGDWFLRFMGLEHYPDYRPGARFENYIAGLSEGAIDILQKLLVRAAVNLELYGPRIFVDSPRSRAEILQQLSRLTLEEMASTRHMSRLQRQRVEVQAVA